MQYSGLLCWEASIELGGSMTHGLNTFSGFTRKTMVNSYALNLQKANIAKMLTFIYFSCSFLNFPIKNVLSCTLEIFIVYIKHCYMHELDYFKDCFFWKIAKHFFKNYIISFFLKFSNLLKIVNDLCSLKQFPFSEGIKSDELKNIQED